MQAERTGNDRTTPSWIVDVVSPIDLDPCCNPWAQTGARVSINKHEGGDGLAADWARLSMGLVYVNPPYGRGELIKWAHKIDREAGRGLRIASLVPLDPSTDWWKALTRRCDGVVHIDKRVHFGGGGRSNPKPNAIVLHGCLDDRPWSTLGTILRPDRCVVRNGLADVRC